MKKSLIVLIGFFTLILSSCIGATFSPDGEVYVTDDTRSITYSTIITYGTPYFLDGVLSYYIYNGIYYYPYYWNNHRYFRPFDHAMPRGYIYRPSVWHNPGPYLRDNRPRINNGPGINSGRSHFNFGPSSGFHSSMPSGGHSMPSHSSQPGSHGGSSHSGGHR